MLLGSACSVDDRDLKSDDGSGGSANSPPPSSEGGAADLPSSNGGGPGAGSTTLVDGCADLDTDGIADCSVTLVENPSFTEDVSGWKAGSGAELEWDEKNALDDLPSGSAKLTLSSARANASQCVAVDGRRLVIAYANAFVAGDAGLGQAELQVSYFDNPTCSGEPTGLFETPRSMVTGAWVTIQAGSTTLPSTVAVSIALVGFKPDGADQLDVYFDNVMLKAQALAE